MSSSRRPGQTGVRCAVLVVIVVFAGCSGAGSPSPTTAPTETASPTLSQQTTTETGPSLLAPGLSTHGVTEPWRLAQAHRSALDDTSFTVVGEKVVRANGTVVVRTFGRTQFAKSHQRYRFTYNVTGTDVATFGVIPFNVSIWSNETTTVQKATLPNGTVKYEEYPPSVPRLRGDPTGADRIYALLAVVNTTVETAVKRNGTTLYRVVSTGPPHPYSTYANASNFTLTAYVAPTGVVHEYTVAYRTTRNGHRVHLTRHVQFVDIGTTDVDPPAWVTKASENETTAAD